MKTSATKLKSINDYFATLSADQRAVLGKLRKAIQSAAPQAEESISYGLPAFRQRGRPLVAFSAGAKHFSLFPMNGTLVAAFKNDLKDFDTSKGTIRFTVTKPLPAALIRKIVQARIKEIAEQEPTKPKALLKTAQPTMDPGVATFLQKLKHRLKPAIEEMRTIILGVSPKISEGIKWNAPSFRTHDDFATMNLRGKDDDERIWLILHTGAKAKGIMMKSKIADPTKLLKWLADDRSLVTFDDSKDIQSKRAALQAIIREWIRKF